MIPATYNLPDAYKGDTYGPLTFFFNDASGNAISLDNSIVNCQVRNKMTKCEAINWSTTGNNVLVSGNQLVLNAISGEYMKIPSQTYIYDLQITQSGVVNTYVKGELIVIQDITNS